MMTPTKGLPSLPPVPPAAQLINRPLLYRVSDVIPLLNLSRSVIFDLIRTGRLRTVNEGRARRIPASAIHEYIALLEQEAKAA